MSNQKIISVNFLKTSPKNKIYKVLHIAVLVSLIFNMSFLGVFFVYQPAGAIDPDWECTGAGFDYKIAEWKWNPCLEKYVVEGVANSTNVTGDASIAYWTADPAVDGVLRKSDLHYTTFPGGISGTVIKDDQDIRHITFCGNESSCELELTKTDTGYDPIKPGEDLVYHLTLTNTGNADCTGGGVQIKDMYDPYTEYISSDPAITETGDDYFVWNFGAIAPGKTEEIDLTMRVSTTTPCDTILINKAKYWSDQTGWGDYVSEETLVKCEEPKDGVLIVKKIVIGGDATSSDWTMHINTNVDFVGSIKGTATILSPAMYSVSETGDISNYILTYSGDCGETGLVSVLSNATSTCILTNTYYEEPYCGDGECNGEETCSTCFEDCGSCGGGGTDPYCGDGKINLSYEECDDGNKISGDGCSDSCRNESGGGGTDPYCGDGKINLSYEECDDGNKMSGDGCSDSCRNEDNISTTTIVYGESGEPMLVMEKNVTAEHANPGDQGIDYYIIITNNGNLSAFDVVLSDELPEGLVYSDDATSTSKEWVLGDISPGEIVRIDYGVDILANAKPAVYINTAMVSASNHASIIDTANIDVREVLVLAETGFSIYEFIGLLSLALSLYVVSFRFRHKIN